MSQVEDSRCVTHGIQVLQTNWTGFSQNVVGALVAAWQKKYSLIYAFPHSETPFVCTLKNQNKEHSGDAH